LFNRVDKFKICYIIKIQLEEDNKNKIFSEGSPRLVLSRCPPATFVSRETLLDIIEDEF